MKKRRYKACVKPEISLTPLIDTALTLLVIFIITAPMTQNGIKLNLPEGKSKESKGEQELVVSVTKDEQLFFNSYPVEKNELVNTVQAALNNQKEKPVFVRADQQVAYGSVIDVVDQLKSSGVRSVAMSTKPRA